MATKLPNPYPHPAFFWMWTLEKAIVENDRRRVKRALSKLRARGFEVKIVLPTMQSYRDGRVSDQERQARANLP